MPYVVHLSEASDATLDRLIELGALDLESSGQGGVTAIMPDRVSPDRVARTLGVETIATSPAVGRDEDSVWLVRPRPSRAGGIEFAPHGTAAGPDAIRLVDTRVFGTAIIPPRRSAWRLSSKPWL